MKKKHGEESEGTSCKANLLLFDCFYRFKARAKLYNVKVSAKAASVGMVPAWKFPEMIQGNINGMYLPQRFFMWRTQDCTGRGCQTEGGGKIKLDLK